MPAAYFTVAEARAFAPLSNTTTYPDADIDNARLIAESALEDVCGLAFVTRTNTEATRDGNGGTDLLLAFPRPTAVTAASVGGVALTAPQLAALVLYSDGRVYNPAVWTEGRGNVSITYAHGFTVPPLRVKRAAILLARRFLVDTPISDRATMLQNQDGTTEYLITAGVRNAIFDIPECNVVVAEYGVRFGIA